MYNTVKHRIMKQYSTLTDSEKEQGAAWYKIAHDKAQELALKHGIDLDRSAAIIAILSPGTAWNLNLKDADAVMSQGEQAIVTTYGANKRKAAGLLNADRNPADYVSGLKVTSFYSNILYPESSDAVTIDRHMIRALLRTSDPKVHAQVFNSRKKYDALAECIRAAAKNLNLVPCQLQAMLWLKVRETK